MPKPGDLVVAQRAMGAWASDEVRLPFSIWANPGDAGCVVQAWMQGNHVRMRLLMKDKLVVFSCRLANVRLNWQVVEPNL